MSTILNALRRLEEDASVEETQPTDSRPATDPPATNELRLRILEEEQAAAVRAEQHSQNLMAQPLPRALAAAAVLLGAISLGVLVIAPRLASVDSPTSPSAKPADLAAALPIHPPENIVPANPPSVANRPPLSDFPAARPTSMPGRQPSNESHLATAAVTPTPAMREATGAIQADTAPVIAAEIVPTPSSRPPIPTRSTGTPIDALPILDDATTANVIDHSIQSQIHSQIESVIESAGERAPETDLNRATEPSVEQHLASPTPDITVLETSWHPTPDYRSAKIRLLATEETRTLREGDAVGRLVVQQITPSAVIFRSGDIELRLRVGLPGSRR